MKIAYVSHTYPQLTQTFVYREVRALRALGLEVVPIAFKRPNAGLHSAEIEEESRLTCYLPPLRSADFWRKAAFGFLRHPVRAVGLLTLGLARDGNPHASRTLPGLVRDWVRGLFLAEFLRRHPEIDHVHTPFSTELATAALMASRLTGRPFSFRNHTCYDAAFIRQKLEQARLALSISDFDRRLLLGYAGGAHAERIHIVHCGIDPAEWTPQVPPVGEPRLLSVGSLIPKKGFPVLIEACRLLADRGVSFHCDIVGGGPMAEELSARIRRLDLADRITLHGALPQEMVREMFARARVFVLACVQTENGDLDGIPVVLMEAMAMGKTCVSTRLSGIPELIDDGTTGLLAEPGNAGDLAAKLERALADDDLVRRIAAAAPEKIARDFHARREAEKLKELFLTRG